MGDKWRCLKCGERQTQFLAIEVVRTECLIGADEGILVDPETDEPRGPYAEYTIDSRVEEGSVRCAACGEPAYDLGLEAAESYPGRGMRRVGQRWKKSPTTGYLEMEDEGGRTYQLWEDSNLWEFHVVTPTRESEPPAPLAELIDNINFLPDLATAKSVMETLAEVFKRWEMYEEAY